MLLPAVGLSAKHQPHPTMFPVTVINVPFAIAETPLPYTDTVMVPVARKPGTYVLIKPHNQENPWYWGVLTREIDSRGNLWEYQRIEPSEIIKLIEQELRENEIDPLAAFDQALSQIRPTSDAPAQVL